MSINWESDIVELLNELSNVQDDLLALLDRKRQLLRAGDVAGMAALQEPERLLAERLQAVHDRRGQLLDRAGAAGLPRDSIRSLVGALPLSEDEGLIRQMGEAAQRARLLQHQSLTHWVLIQRSLLHLSQLLEIIATGGRPRPTYGMGESVHSTGSVMDHAA